MMPEPPPGVERILFTQEQIEQRIDALAAQISERYKDKNLKLIGVLKGSVFFLAALARRLRIPAKIDFLAISSFSNKSGAPGLVRIAKDLDDSIEGEDVLLIEDIVDTGFTLRSSDLANARQPRTKLAGGVHISRSQLAAHRASSCGVSMFRDSRSFCHWFRP